MSRLVKCAVGWASVGLLVWAIATPAALAQQQPPPKQPQQQPPPEQPKDTPAAPTDPKLANCPERDTRPWACGISKDNQQKALLLFTEGNSLVQSTLFANAVDKYREALKYWPHPAIHYNLALALIFTKDPVGVYRSLEKAVVYGPKPLGKDNFDHANKYKTLIMSQLAWLDVRCDIPGAAVTLDNEELFVAPGSKKILVKAGKHVLNATKKGYIGGEVSRIFAPAEHTTVKLQLFTEADLTRHRRNWKTWKPWAVVGGGAAVAGIGLLVHMLAKSDFQEFDNAIAMCGGATPGCTPDQSIRDMRTGAETKQSIAMVSYVVGGAAVVGGLILAYMNRAQPYRVDVDEHKKSLGIAAGGLNVLPLVSRDTAGIGASFEF